MEEKQQDKKESRASSVIKAHFTAPRIAYMAIFTALAFVVTFLEFPIFPQAGFLKLDFANVFFLIEGFMFGPIEAFVSICLKELLCFTKSSTGGVGEVANLIMSTAYILIPSIAYRFKRGKWWVCLYLVLSCIVQTGASLIVNRYINFPFFAGEGGAVLFQSLWVYVLCFNLIKSVVMGVIVFLIYKPLSKFINMTAKKYEKRMAAMKQRRKEARDEISAAQTGEILLQNPDDCDIISNMEFFLSHSERETAEWAARYAKTLAPGDVVLLNGEMGAGKTAIAKGIAQGLGIVEEVTSPTYAYINSYGDKLFHFDCYRVEDEAQAERLGFADYFEMGGICLVEWGENIRGLLPSDCKEIQIIKRGDETREIRF